ncbi:MAG: methyltransferase domain-containing protein [Alphaproteobacteria bacterium]|nr:methyltransferase domain-containing protein [Alphaproteobacteria bacterium]MDE2163471.1 methyltransferase domain-containing protein [Alphaproteobacteria bacterium]MDE2500016.1 methyltransferase domain-containing protein [Alphaproteobacteria bacterium]
MNRTQWNQLADTFETEVCDIAREETRDQLSRLVRAVDLSPKDSVLVDLGCGVGTFIQKFHHRFHEVTAVEFAPRIIARAKKNCTKVPRVRWLTMDIPRSAKSIGTVADLTVCMNVITSPSRAKRNSIWSAIARVTKPRSHALIVVPSLESERMVQRVSRNAPPTLPGGLVQRDDAVQKHFERAELMSTLSRAGFAPMRIARIYYPWSKEGMRKPRSGGGKGPWDWVCLARRNAGVRSRKP